jgi:[amino-group carrier protein]-gamma-(L-lysyl/L-ornithyl)-L-glutamate aminotransferase
VSDQVTQVTFETIQAREDAHDSGVFAKRPIALARGQGARVWDSEGKEYIDCIGAYGAANVGHCHPRVVAVMQAQAAKLTLCPGTIYNEERSLLLERLTSLAPAGLDRAFLCSTGTEANEGALKLARLVSGRPGVVAAMRGFHGRTYGSLSATWDQKYREPFAPLVPGFSHVPYDNLAKMDAAITDETGAVILEVVQGEGGVRPGSGDYLRGVQELCRERGALLIIDEVQTGMGRTGKLFACEHHGLTPDLLTLAKSLGGGMPVGAVLLGERIKDLPLGCHGSTFGGNALACAVARAALEVIVDEDLAGRAARLGAHAIERLRALDAPQVREVRGLGLLLGVELKGKSTPVVQALLERSVLALPAGPTVLRLLPPLVITDEELERVLDALAESLAACA